MGSGLIKVGVPSTKCSEHTRSLCVGSHLVLFSVSRFIARIHRSLCSELRNLLGNQYNLNGCLHTHNWCKTTWVEQMAIFHFFSLYELFLHETTVQFQFPIIICSVSRLILHLEDVANVYLLSAFPCVFYFYMIISTTMCILFLYDHLYYLNLPQHTKQKKHYYNNVTTTLSLINKGIKTFVYPFITVICLFITHRHTHLPTPYWCLMNR